VPWSSGFNRHGTEDGSGDRPSEEIGIRPKLCVIVIGTFTAESRRLVVGEGLAVVGCIGILERLYRRAEIVDLRRVYQELLRQNIRVDRRTLQDSLNQFGLGTL